MKLYKLTDEKDQTQNNTQWGVNVSHATNGAGDLCGPGWLHAYSHPLLAVLFNPRHANFDSKTMHLWEAKGTGQKKFDGQMKLGVTTLKTMKRLLLPRITIIQRCRFAILCAKAVYTNKQFNKWADEWLSGKDRSRDAAYAAAYAADAAAYAAAYAAYAAAYAAYAANEAAYAAYAAAYAADAAAYAANEAAYAAAKRRGKKLNLAKLAELACRED